METRNGKLGTQRGQSVLNLTEDQARAYIEKLLWPDGKPVCRRCGSVNAYKMQGAACRPGLCRCRDCKTQFTVTVGTIFEDSHLPLATWVKAFHLMVSAKKGISALQLQRNLGLGSYKTAWHLAHRIRLAMKCEPMGGLLKGTVECDETYIGGKPRPGTGKHKRGRGTSKTPVFCAVERNGRIRRRVVANISGATLKAAVREVVSPTAVVMTDEHDSYNGLAAEFAGHERVNHSIKEYVRGDVHSNTAESSHALLKRGIVGAFHHVSKEHLHRYLAEFDFRWDHRKVQDAERRELALKQVEGKRLMYKQPA